MCKLLLEVLLLGRYLLRESDDGFLDCLALRHWGLVCARVREKYSMG